MGYINSPMESSDQDPLKPRRNVKLVESLMNGKKQWEANYKEGKEDGLVLTWHENGQKHGESHYKNGKKISGKWWNSKGEPVDSLEEASK